MTDSMPGSAAPPAPPDDPAAKPAKEGFTFTDPGCNTLIRVGGLLALAAVFLWLWLGPVRSGRLYLLGAPLLLIGVPLQAWQARTAGRPGFPWKLGTALAVAGAVMWLDLRYRETVDGPVHVQEIAWLLLGAGAWILAWWPLARPPRPAPGAVAAA